MPCFFRSGGAIVGGSVAGIATILDVAKLAAVWLGEDPAKITDVTTITTSSQKLEVLFNLIADSARMAVLEEKNWQFALREEQLKYAPGTLQANGTAMTITGITQANPAVVTAVAHGFEDDWLVAITGVVGMTEINNRIVRVANKAANNFECYGLDSTAFTAYASGGQVQRQEAIPDYQNGYIYLVPDDLLRPVAAIPAKQNFEIVGSGSARRVLSPARDLVLQYVANVSSPAYMPNHFIRCWAARVAAEIAPAMQKKGASMKEMMANYAMVLNEGNKSNARQADPNTLVADRSSILSAAGWLE